LWWVVCSWLVLLGWDFSGFDYRDRRRREGPEWVLEYTLFFLWDEMKVHEIICYCHNDADLNLESSFSYVCLSLFFSVLSIEWSGATRAKREKLGDPSTHSISDHIAHLTTRVLLRIGQHEISGFQL